MSERKINLEEILKKQIDCNYPSFTFLDGDSIPWKDVIKSMKEACRQALELAAENAKTITKNIEYRGVRAGGYYAIKVVDKQSILNTINQIE